MSEAERDAVWLQLPARLTSLAVGVRLLPWVRDELASWATDTIAARRGTWVTGAPGASAEFPCTHDRQIKIAAHDDAVVARATDAAFRLRVTEKLRAFAFGDGGPIVLGLPKARAALPSTSTVAALGPDADAIDETRRGDRLFDFGIGRRASRFLIRTGDETLASALDHNAGRHWSEVMPAIGMEILTASPNRVVESAVARIEVFAPIPAPGVTPPPGAHTHFLPDFLKSGEEIPAALALPEFAAPVAIFYPATGRG